jgi:TonB family protein
MKVRRSVLLLAGLLFALPALPVLAQSMQKTSLSGDSLGYRTGAARHIYATYAERIYKGMLPPLVHAIVVVETEVDPRGNVREIRVVRAPSHAPDVTESVKAMIRRAAPFPPPSNAANTKFVEVWLVDHSGRFQLHALTEGQL